MHTPPRRWNLGTRADESSGTARRSLARLLGGAVAVLAVLVAIPATAGAASVPSTITIGNETTPADAPPVTFHLTGPTCGTVPTDFTFALANGESKTFTLCDANPSPVSGRFFVVEDVPDGWTLSDITCDNDDADPADFLIIDLPAATAKIELSQFNEFKSCVFHNVAPTPPVLVPPAKPIVTTTSTPKPSAPAAVAPQPPVVQNQAVGGVQSTSPARVNSIAAETTCASRTARVTIRGRGMRDITLSVNRHRVKTVRVASGARTVRTSVPIARGAGPQTVTARVRFRNGTRARTISTRARRCAPAAVQPNFTG
jgi:hypothetical protein